MDWAAKACPGRAQRGLCSLKQDVCRTLSRGDSAYKKSRFLCTSLRRKDPARPRSSCAQGGRPQAGRPGSGRSRPLAELGWAQPHPGTMGREWPGERGQVWGREVLSGSVWSFLPRTAVGAVGPAAGAYGGPTSLFPAGLQL